MKIRTENLLGAFLLAAGMLACQAALGKTLVSTQAEYFEAADNAKAGDTITLANGVWQDFEIVIDAQGTAQKPVTLEAESVGKVIISGQSNLRIAGNYVVVRGLVFRNGFTPTREVISFRRDKDNLAYNSRVTETVIDHFNNPERYETDFWVMMYGNRNRFDHNHLEGKSNAGVTMAVRLDSPDSVDNRHRIDHNYFGPRPVLGSNGGETLRIGTSKYSLQDSNTLVERNYFDRCDGEVEIISSKSGGNVFRGNVFFESRGTLTLRHGNGNLVEDNVFLGNGVDHTGGIRVINKRQTVRNNYLSGLTGHRFGGALVIMNGVPDSPINRYHQVEDSLIENNTILDSSHIELAAGSDEERSAVPLSTIFRNNLIVNASPMDSIAVHDDISGISFDGNVTYGLLKAPSETGFSAKRIELATADNGLHYPRDDTAPTAGVSHDLNVIDRDATGVSWYPKPGYGGRFDTGKTHAVSPGEDSLFDAIAAAAAGDSIELQAGEYRVTKILVVGKPLTIRGMAGAPRPVIRFERSALFELADGGSLKLAGIVIDGDQAPDAYGNAAIRTSKYSMLQNYQLIVSNSLIRNLNTNHSFDFLQVSMSTFAASIDILDSQFEAVTGHVVRLARETDDLGRYNAEYVTIKRSEFRDIDKTLANVYRGGTDESTFGPHFALQDSELVNVGNGKRNKTRASLRLLGVQSADIRSNRFEDSRPIRVQHTVGEPVTRIVGNRFVDTPGPIVSDDTATLADNVVSPRP